MELGRLETRWLRYEEIGWLELPIAKLLLLLFLFLLDIERELLDTFGISK